MGKKKIPADIIEQAIREIEKYNAANYSPGSGTAYKAYAKGDYLYVDRKEHGRDTKMFRLLFCGKIDNWDFEIFKWSSERYSDDTFFMPGEEFLDGTVTGAMKAADELYPPPGK